MNTRYNRQGFSNNPFFRLGQESHILLSSLKAPVIFR
jgi:hypothetical protein